MTSMHADLQTYLAAKIQETVEYEVNKRTRKVVEEVVREEISKFMKGFLFVTATPSEVRGAK